MKKNGGRGQDLSRLGRYDLVRRLRDAPPWYIAREASNPPGCTLLIRAIPTETSGRSYFGEERALLGVTDCPALPRLLDVGHDDAAGVEFYVLSVPTTDELRLVSALSLAERKRWLRGIVVGLGAVHTLGVVYRNFTMEAFIASDVEVFLYDLSRAAAMSADGTVVALSPRAPFDPPEVTLGRYDGVKGDVFGLGVIVRAVADRNRELETLAAMMMDEEPSRRPTMSEVIERMDGSASESR